MEINGKKVVDATRSAKIHINARDVIEGDNKNPSSCAAARAAKRDIDDCLSARVHIGRVYIEQKSKWVRYFTPKALRTEIVAFDRGGSFMPGDYVLNVPSPSNDRRQGRPSGSNNPERSNKSRKIRKIHVAKIKRHEVSGVRPKGANR